MKIKNAAAICGRQKAAYLYDETDGAQWLGDGRAMYFLGGMPRLDEHNVLTMLDVPAKKRGEWKAYMLERISWANIELTDEDEELIDILWYGFSFRMGGADFLPVRTQAGTFLINQKYFSPITDAEHPTHFLRMDPQPHLIVKEGFLLIAVIPVEPMPTDMGMRLDELRRGLNKAKRWFEIDAETGELPEA